MSRAIRIHETGGPEVLRWEEVEVPAPGAGEVRVRHRSVGLNFIDTYYRSGLYPLAELPVTLGMEAAGEVVACGAEVAGMAEGDRVAYVQGRTAKRATCRPPASSGCPTRSPTTPPPR